MNKGRRPAEQYLSCPYNVAVECEERGETDINCFFCGWFPMESRRRRERLRVLAKHNCLRKEAKYYV